ncbi:hypothetical protein SAMN05216428_10288 [Nitrosospira sp. Nsp11]|uniref:hypothetical protein n=1 Tax=Nitrosospira sp. Nsp11 TaxID=1855338 RepID=UPI000919EA37|nr:hypothetical protein [Nitrosospira sp. Nsp11]SHL34186.1 hypothetical protein SAMN05216428_10288 [Nitrosospira sp. Nsp11]
MSDASSGMPGMVTNKIGAATSDLVGNAVEQPEKSSPSGTMAADASESVEREQGKSHHVVSTTAYYSVEGYGPDGYFYDEAQDWLEADAETGGVLYGEKDF